MKIKRRTILLFMIFSQLIFVIAHGYPIPTILIILFSEQTSYEILFKWLWVTSQLIMALWVTIRKLRDCIKNAILIAPLFVLISSVVHMQGMFSLPGVLTLLPSIVVFVYIVLEVSTNKT